MPRMIQRISVRQLHKWLKITNETTIEAHINRLPEAKRRETLPGGGTGDVREYCTCRWDADTMPILISGTRPASSRCPIARHAVGPSCVDKPEAAIKPIKLHSSHEE